jgi:hypothetical protein
MKTKTLVANALAALWCGSFPTALFAVWALNLSTGDAIALLGAIHGVGLIAGLFDDTI